MAQQDPMACICPLDIQPCRWNCAWLMHGRANDGTETAQCAVAWLTANVGALEKTVDRLVGEVERLGSSEC